MMASTTLKLLCITLLSFGASAAWAQEIGLLRCEDGKGGVTYVEKFCPEGFKGVKDVRRPITKTEVEMENDFSKKVVAPAEVKKPLTEGQARACVGRRSELEAARKRLTSMEGKPKYDDFAKRVQKMEEKYEADCRR
jgi:hypothetical protein